MIIKLLRKFSSLLLRLHLYINRRFKEKTSFAPYRLNYAPSTSEIKIIHVNGNFIVGGSTQLIVDIIERTSDKYSHQVIVPAYPEPIPYEPVSIYQFSIDRMVDLYKHLEKEKPALVHIHYWMTHSFEPVSIWYATVFRMCEQLGLKVIQNINVPTEPFLSPAIVHNVYVSKYVAENYNGDNPTALSVVYPGSDFSHFKNDDFRSLPGNSIGMVYRLDTDKLNAEAIEVFIAAVRKKPDLQCYIIGAGHYFRYYKNRVKEEQLSGNFIFTGVVSYKSLPEYYKKFAVFVTPVHAESFGQVTPFAMSMGLSVAGYDIGALSEILGDKDTLVEYGDIEGLADVIVGLVNNPEKRVKLGQFNQQRAHENFSVESMISRYEKLYEIYAKDEPSVKINRAR
jgi:glycosyltransferase involved in cell wall biosynthesis